MRTALVDFTGLDDEIVKQYEEIEVIAELVKNIVKENASTPQSQDEYIKKYNSLSKKYEEEYKKLENLQKDKELRVSKDKAMEVFIENLKNNHLWLKHGMNHYGQYWLKKQLWVGMEELSLFSITEQRLRKKLKKASFFAYFD